MTCLNNLLFAFWIVAIQSADGARVISASAQTFSGLFCLLWFVKHMFLRVLLTPTSTFFYTYINWKWQAICLLWF